MKKLSPQELQERRKQEEERRIFERKIEEDRLGISRRKQKRVMQFRTYRIIKLVLLGLTAVMLFIYTPAVAPLSVCVALMLIVTKRLEKEKNKNVNKKYRIRIKAADSVIAILMIVLTIGVCGYNLVTAYMNGGSLNTTSFQDRFADAGFNQSQINVAISRRTGENAYERIANDALSLLTGNRNIFQQRRMIFRGSPPNFEGMGDTNVVRKRPNMLQMMRRMPLEMLFRQIFQMVCAVMVGVMVLVGVINVIESFKYGEIKKVTLGKKFDAPTGANDLCLCGSGKKIKHCDCGQWWRKK